MREWLNAQAAGGYVTYDGRPLHAARRARRRARRRGQPGVPPRRLPADDGRRARRAEDHRGVPQRGRRRLARAQTTALFEGCERFFRPGYRANLVESWIPALDGVEAKLAAGARVADVGCGHGASTMIMAEAYPASSFVGFDYHDDSIERGDRRARRRGPRQPGAVRRRLGAGLPGHRLRPGHDVRLPARHGRPRRRRAPHPRGARQRRHVADRRAVRRRPRRGQPEPGRPRLLRRLDAASARPRRSPRTSGSRSAPRPARRGCATSSPRAASRASAAPPRRRSTSCSRRGRDRHADHGRARADARPLPGRGGLRRARRRADLLRGLRRRRADRPAAADVVDHPLAPLEGADPLPRAPLPRRHLRRARQRQVGPPARRRALHRGASSPPTRSPCMDATGTERAVLVGLSCGALWGTLLAAEHPDRVSARSPTSARRCRSRSGTRSARSSGASRTSSTPTRAGRSTTATTGSADYQGFLEFFFAQMFNEPHSTKQIEDCIGWALETDPETLADTTSALNLCGTEEFAEVCRARAVPGARDPRRPGPDPPARRRARRSREVTGGELVTLEGAGHGPQARDPVKVNLLLREFVAPAPARARRGRAAAAGASGRCSSPRRSASATPAATSRSRRSCARCTPTSRSTGSPRTRSPGCSRPRASASTRRAACSRTSRATSSPSPPSTTCTASTAWRRMDEILVANFMVFDDVVREQRVRPLDRRRGVGRSTTTCTRTRSSSAPRTCG